MSLRTYSLIVHPEFLRYVAGAHESGFPVLLPYGTGEGGVPEIASIYALAGYLQVSPRLIGWMLRDKEVHYNTFPVRKRSGGYRFISSPRTFLKVVQWWILDTILSVHSPLPCVHGFVRGRSFKTNASSHLGANHILNVDIENFFPSISLSSVQKAFELFGYYENVANSLAEFCTLSGHLPQGAPTSPSLANIVMHGFDQKFLEYCRYRGYTYTRYADDITISSKIEKIDEKILLDLGLMLNDNGFTLNDKKTKWMGLNDRKEVTGLRLGKSEVGLPRSKLNSARGWFYSISVDPDRYMNEFKRLGGTLELIKFIGGPGSSSVISLGMNALFVLRTRINQSVARPI